MTAQKRDGAGRLIIHARLQNGGTGTDMVLSGGFCQHAHATPNPGRVSALSPGTQPSPWKRILTQGENALNQSADYKIVLFGHTVPQNRNKSLRS